MVPALLLLTDVRQTNNPWTRDPRRPVGRRFARAAGHSVIEVLVVLAIAALMILFFIPPLLDYLTRADLEQNGRQAEVLLRKARQKAITLQAPVRVEPQADGLFAFADLDNDTAFNNADEAIDTLDLSPKVEWVATSYTAVFRPNGSADAVGAYRMRNRDGSELRVRVTSLATGNVSIEKLY